MAAQADTQDPSDSPGKKVDSIISEKSLQKSQSGDN